MIDICALGEMVIDFTPVCVLTSGLPTYEQNAGGAPANVACAAAKLGASTALITMLSKDYFGKYLRKTLVDNKVSLQGVRYCNQKVGLAFISLTEKGARSFNFYRENCADQMLSSNLVDYKLLKSSHIFHFSSVSLSHHISRDATLSALNFALENNKIVSFDINFRSSIWKNLDEGFSIIKPILKKVSILKMSEREALLFSESSTLEQAINFFSKSLKSLTVITLGGKGCAYIYNDHIGKIPGHKIIAVDSTGAGDNFVGGMLAKICSFRKAINDLSNKEIHLAMEYANIAGAICASRFGTISALATKEELEIQLLNFQKRHLNIQGNPQLYRD